MNQFVVASQTRTQMSSRTRFLILLVAAFCMKLSQAGDGITKTGYSLQIQLETTNLNVIELGKTNVYTRLPRGTENIKITCTKLDCNRVGTLIASVNHVYAAKLGNCAAYSPGLHFAENTCYKQTFQYSLNLNDETSVYQILCRLNETYYADSIGFNLYKLYADSIPRIRAGMNLDKPGVLTIHYTSSIDSLSCEAVQDKSSAATFDSIGFYTYDSNQNLNLPVTATNITNTAINYSVAFDPNALIRNIQLYKCCTTLQGQFVRCQGVYVINDLFTTSIGPTVSNGNAQNTPCAGQTTTRTATTTTTAATYRPCTSTTTTTTTSTPWYTTPWYTTPRTTTTCRTTTPCRTTPMTTPWYATWQTTPCSSTTTSRPWTTTTTCRTTASTTPCPTTTTTCRTTTTTTTPCTTTTTTRRMTFTTPCSTTSTTTPCSTTTTTTPCYDQPGTTEAPPTYRPSTRPWFCATCSSNTFEPKSVLFILLNAFVLYFQLS